MNQDLEDAEFRLVNISKEIEDDPKSVALVKEVGFYSKARNDLS